MAAGVCYYFKYGHCKFQSNCRNKHVEDLCENPSCEIAACEKRHPKKCKYFLNFGRCKFLYCSYKHEHYDRPVEDTENIAHLKEEMNKTKSELKF